MRRRRLRWWAWVLVVATLPILAVVAAGAWQRSLEACLKDLTPRHILQDPSLRGRVSSLHWQQSGFRWWPRPQLVVRSVEVEFLSGRPGSGINSARLELDTVRLVPRWDYLLHHQLEKIEAVGGNLYLARDLVPELPLRYLDPVEGDEREVPWDALLAVAGDSAAGSPPAPWRLDVTGPQRFSPAPAVVVEDLQISTAALEAFEGTSLRLEKARLVLVGDRLDVLGRMVVTRKGGAALTVPVRLSRRGLRGGVEWSAGAGGAGENVRLGLRTAAGLAMPAWTVDLEDSRGRLGAAILRGRSGALQRLRWSGPWHLQAHGTGPFPQGLEDARIDLLGGRLYLEGPHPIALATARGRLRVKPGLVELSTMTLRRVDVPEDSATVQFAWVRTPRGKRVHGRLDGAVDPAWLGLAGRGWRSSGRLLCAMGFEADQEDPGGGWRILPGGNLEGSLDSLSGPWFLRGLRDGKLQAWTEQGRLRAVLVGQWGSSPFRLEARGLPPPSSSGYLERIYSDAQWSFRSPWCRLEDFRISPESFSRAGWLPFWLAFPGRGTVEIERGTLRGVPFDSLDAVLWRSPRGAGVDSLNVYVAGGRLWTRTPIQPPGLANGPGIDTRLSGSNLDLAEVQRILGTLGLPTQGELKGRMSGEVRLRRFDPGPVFSSGRTVIEGNLHAGPGSVRGLPVQEALRRSAHLDGLAVLSFTDWKMDFRQDSGGFSWNRLQIEAAPLRIEGAGRIHANGTLRAALVVRLVGGGTGPLAGVLRALLGESNSALYAVLEGSPRNPSLELVSRSSFLRELERLGGALPGPGH